MMNGFPKVKYLVNWTQAYDCCGGSESRYANLKRAFPEAELISVKSLTESKSIKRKRQVVDSFLNDNTNKNDIVIRDAGVGGISEIKAKTVLIFGNPYLSLSKKFPNKKFSGAWGELIKAQVQDSEKSSLNIANSAFTKYDAELSGSKIDPIIPNGVDINFWVPSKKIKKYPLWVGSDFKEKSINLRLNELYNLVKVYKRFKLSKEIMLGLYQSAFYLCNPFPIEGNCNAILEAMSCDIPIISTKSGWFWDKSFKGVGYEYRDMESALKLTGKLIESHKLTPRKYIIDNGLTLNDYINNMRGIIQCIH